MYETQNFSDWIGREHAPLSDLITPRLCDCFEATLAPNVVSAENAALGIHWCLAPPIVASTELSEDGHPAKGNFLPPIPLPRRMWASGELEFLAPLKLNDEVQKASTIRDIKWKSGKSGQLCFVEVGHDYSTSRGLAIRESQHIVYRESAIRSAPITGSKICDKTFDKECQVAIDSATLFRYSALTFNAHRIHYDYPYATGSEFYSDLVIHGPLLATVMLHMAASIENMPPKRFRFRALAPATGEQTLRAGASMVDNTCELSVVTANGVEAMSGVCEW